MSSEQYHSYITITRLTRMCIWASILIDQITMEEFEDTKGAIKNRQSSSRETGNIVYTGRRKTQDNMCSTPLYASKYMMSSKIYQKKSGIVHFYVFLIITFAFFSKYKNKLFTHQYSFVDVKNLHVVKVASRYNNTGFN